MLKLISTMLGMKLSYVQDKNEDGQLIYKLDPSVFWHFSPTSVADLLPAHSPIDVFVHFDGKRAADIAPSRYAVRHLITREVRFAAFCLSSLSSLADLRPNRSKPKRSVVRKARASPTTQETSSPLTMCKSVCIDDRCPEADPFVSQQTARRESRHQGGH